MLTAGGASAEESPHLDVHYVPTPTEVVEQMLDMARVGPEDVVYDLGCGDGRIVIAAVKDRNAKRGVGIDLDPRRITESEQNAGAAGVEDRVTFLQKDLFASDISEPTVITMYLLSNLNRRLIPKLFAEARPGTRVVSHDFDMGNWKPDNAVEIKGTRTHAAYYWMLPANVSGAWVVASPDGGGKDDLTVEIQQVYQQLQGTASDGNGSRALASARIEGTAVSFTTDPPVLHFTGKVEGDVMRGNVEAVDGAIESFTARRREGTKREIVPPDKTADQSWSDPGSGADQN